MCVYMSCMCIVLSSSYGYIYSVSVQGIVGRARYKCTILLLLYKHLHCCHKYSPPEMVWPHEANIRIKSSNTFSAVWKRSIYSGGARVLTFDFNVSLSIYDFGLGVREMFEITCRKTPFFLIPAGTSVMSPSPWRQCKWTGKLLKVCSAGISYDVTQPHLRWWWRGWD